MGKYFDKFRKIILLESIKLEASKRTIELDDSYFMGKGLDEAKKPIFVVLNRAVQ